LIFQNAQEIDGGQSDIREKRHKPDQSQAVIAGELTNLVSILTTVQIEQRIEGIKKATRQRDGVVCDSGIVIRSWY
jgi:hypothetical protein